MIRCVSRKLLVGMAVLGGIMAGCGAEPSKEKISEALKPIMPPNFTVGTVEKFQALEGVYEVVVVINNQPSVLYLDKKLKHVISGSVVEIASKKNLTYETQMKNKPAVPPQGGAQQAVVPQQKPK